MTNPLNEMADTQKDIMRYLLEQVKSNQLDRSEALNYLKYLEGAAKPRGDDIAIIGLACRFPDANNKNQYWQNLARGKSSIGPFPSSRKADLAALDDSLATLFNGGFLDEIRDFDNEYFNIPPAVASHMDPYHRLLLESFIETIEDAGYSRNELYGKNIGVYTGNDHTHRLFNSYLNFIDQPDFNSITGSWTAVLASRIAYLLNLQGPALVVDTSCSSALVAIDIAVKALRDGDCEAALVGAANLFFAPGKGIVGDVENDEFVVRAFDQGASGTVWGEGIASLLLKPLSRAIKDGDDIYGVIQGIAVNNDGASNGITAPSAKAQEQVLNKAWKRADISPEDLSYIESHGTGTHLGDPIEIRGLTNAIAKHSKRKQFCGLGSVKTNIGHTVGVAGLASLIKVLLSFKNNQLPPSLNFNDPNPLIDFCQSPVYINDQLTDWPPRVGAHRFAGISSFSLSGTNCHVVLRDENQSAHQIENRRPLIFILTGRTLDLLRENLENHVNYLKDNSVDYHRACFTSAVGRELHRYRIACVVTDINDLMTKLHTVTSYLGEQDLDKSSYGLISTGIWCSEALDVKTDKLTELEKTASEIIQRPTNNTFEMLAPLFVRGARINWKPLFTQEESRRAHLPAQPWKHNAFWPTVARRNEVNIRQQPDLSIRERIPFICSQPSRISGLPNTTKGTSNNEKTIAWIIAEVLGYDTIESSSNYYELGGDSILGAKIVNLANEVLNTHIQISDLMASDSVADFIEKCTGDLAVSKEPTNDIPNVQDRPNFELSKAQERMLILSSLVTNPCSYNVNALLEIDAIPDIEHTRKVLLQLIERHEILRTGYRMINGKSMQFVLPIENIVVDVATSVLPDNVNNQNLAEWVNSVIKPFDLERPPLLRVFFAIDLSLNQCYMVVDMHHIATDGASMGVLVADFMKLSGGQNLPPLAIQYKDYAAWHNSLLDSGSFKKHAEYWRNQFTTVVPNTNLPLDYPRPPMQQFVGAKVHHKIPPSLLHRAKKLAAEQGVSLFMLLNAVFRLVLYKYQVGTDIVVGSPVTGRNHPQLNNLIGMFVNTLPMRFKIEPKESFKQCLKRIKHSILEDFSHQDYPFEALIADLNLSRDTTRNPLFDVYFVFQNEDMGLSDSGVKVVPHDTHTTKFDLSAIFREETIGGEANLVADWEFSTAIFKKSTISRLARHFHQMLHTLCEFPARPVAELSVLSKQETHYQVFELNNNKTDYPSTQSLTAIFEKHVSANPEKVALRYIREEEKTELTYTELNTKSNQLAAHLLQQNMKNNAVVALYLPRSIDMVVAILASLKCGFVYIPLDSDNPIERINDIIIDSEAAVVITHSSMPPITERSVPAIALDAVTLTHYATDNPITSVNGDSIAYIMYTSGTTGKPKGTIIRHKSISRVVTATNYLNLGPKDNCLQVSSFAFDGCVPDLYGALLNGATLVLPSKELILDLPKLGSLLIEQKITSMFVTTSLFNVMIDNILESMKNVKNIIFGGEAASVNHVSKGLNALGPNRLINGYGPTETTVFATAHIVNEIDFKLGSIPIGTPLTNTNVYVLDEALQLVPIGATAELYIGGDGVALGYLNRNTLTSDHFVANPFSPNDTLYRTGDLVKRLDDGTILYIGRKDTQVKIRGFRIELGEIKTCLTQNELISDAAVTADFDDSGSRQLVAWVVTKEVETFDIDALKQWLHTKLPEYMVPAALIPISEIPLNINGKLDYSRLPHPGLTAQSLVAARNDKERLLLALWKQVLAVPAIGIHDNFFSLGGDSIKGIRLVALLQQQGLNATIGRLFEHPTIAGLAMAIEPVQSSDKKRVDQTPVTGELLLSPVQRWFFKHLHPDLNYFNHSMWIPVDSLPSLTKLNDALRVLVTHHDLLRCTFVQNAQGEWQATITEPGTDQYHVERFTGLHWKVGEASTDAAIQSIQASISIQNGRLLSVGLFETPNSNSHFICIAAHHLVVDVVSWPILLEDFDCLLSANEETASVSSLPEKTISYQAWNKQLYDYVNSEISVDAKKYWIAIARKDYLLVPVSTVIGTLATSEIHIDRVEKCVSQTILGSANTTYTTEPVHLLLCALAITLNRVFGKGQPLIQLEGHGRHAIPNAESSSVPDRTIGWFTSIFPHVLPQESSDLAAMIKEVKEGVRRIPDRGREFGLLTYLDDSLDSDVKSILESIRPQIGFNFLGNNPIQNEDVTPLSRHMTCSPETPQPLLLDIVVSTSNGQIVIETLFDSDRFTKAMASSFFLEFIEALQAINNHCLDTTRTEKTASDFTGDIEQQELEDIFDDLELI